MLICFTGLEAVLSGNVEGKMVGKNGEHHRLYVYVFPNRCPREEWWQRKVLDRASVITLTMCETVVKQGAIDLLSGKFLLGQPAGSCKGIVAEILLLCILDDAHISARRHLLNEWLS